ncbi:MAG: hypothetical protein IH577_02650 [Deltaproteobacteria bacterium]|nr:hypothetical protein [Deltaproteobacteria bacterium]
MTKKQPFSNLPALSLILLLSFALAGCGGGGDAGTVPPNGAAPATQVSSATEIDVADATLNGVVNPNGLATTALFEWGTSPTLSSYASTPDQNVGSGVYNVPISAQISGLADETTYYYRVCATNSQSTIRSAITTFTTASAGVLPGATTTAATSVGATSATLNGTVTPNNQSTSAWFEWGTSSSLSSYTSTSAQDAGSGTASQAISAGLTGLTSGTTYYFRVAASNTAGTVKGAILSFVPGAPPTVSTLSATSVGVSTATLNGTATPNGLAATAWFEWGTSSTLSSYSSTSSQAIGSGTTSQPVTRALSGLSAGTVYYFRVVAQNASGTQRGTIRSFTTTSSSGAPLPTTLEPERIATGAICNGKVNPNGIESTAWIEWGTDPDLTSYNTSSSQSIGSGTSNRYLSEPLTFLTSGTTYYCRVAGQNPQGTSKGTIASFTAITGTWTINDDFTDDDTIGYSVSGSGSFSHDPGTGKAEVETGSGETLTISKGTSDGGIGTGTFSMEFRPTAENGSAANLLIQISDTPLTYFEFSANDGWFRKYRRGEIVDSTVFPNTYTVGNTYTIKITFGQMVATVEAFGGRVSIDDNDSTNPVNYINISATELDATYDNIRVTKEQ